MKRRLEDFRDIQRKLNYTFLNGVFLVINAIPDAYLLLDAPPCGYNKMYFVHKTHDLFSDLSRRNTTHRICCTEVRPDDIIHERDDQISRLMLRVAKEKDCGVVLVCSMPMATITGTQYGLIADKAQKKTSIPLLEIPSKSLQMDWLGGYDETLLAMAGKMDLKKNSQKSGNAAIVGYLFDRNEGDHIGNLNELARILAGLSLDLVSVWLSGCPFGRLRDIEKAKTIISLPYGRKAAREIARKTGADLIELDIPLGIENTKEWVCRIGSRLGRSKQAQTFIDEELKEVIPVNNLVAPEYILGKTFSLAADPYLCHCLAGTLTDLGGKISQAVIFGTPQANKNIAFYKQPSFDIIYEPRYGEAFDLDTSKADIFIGNSQISSLLRIKNNKKPFIELGFPSFNYHCLSVSPLWGFKGYVNFLNRIINSRGEGHEESQ